MLTSLTVAVSNGAAHGAYVRQQGADPLCRVCTVGHTATHALVSDHSQRKSDAI